MTHNSDPLGDIYDDRVSENSDVIHYSEEDQFVSDGGFASSESDWDFEEDIMKMSACTCTCATLSRALKMDCPMSSRNRYASHSLFPKVSPGESQADKEGGEPMLTKISECPVGSTQLCKRERLDETPSVKKSKRDFSSFKVGDHVCVHVGRLEKYHIPCHVVQVVNKGCKLYCCEGLLNMC